MGTIYTTHSSAPEIKKFMLQLSDRELQISDWVHYWQSQFQFCTKIHLECDN